MRSNALFSSSHSTFSRLRNIVLFSSNRNIFFFTSAQYCTAKFQSQHFLTSVQYCTVQFQSQYFFLLLRNIALLSSNGNIFSRLRNSALCGALSYFQRMLWSRFTLWTFTVNRIWTVIADNLARVIFHHFKSLSHNLRIWQIFVSCAYLPRCGNSVLTQILPHALFPPTVCKCDTSPKNRRCLFCYQFQTNLQIHIFVR